MLSTKSPASIRSLFAAALSLLACGTASPVNAQPTAQGYVRIQNYWDPQFQINAETEDLAELRVVSPAFQSADWLVEGTPGRSSVRLKNRWRGTYLKVDNHTKGLSLVPGENIGTEKWIFEATGAANRYRIRPLALPGEYLSIENGRLDIGPAEPGWLSAQWVMRDSTARAAPEQCVKNMSGTILQVDWYKARDVRFQRSGANIVPVKYGPVIESNKVSLFFSSCEKQNELMYAVVRVVGREAATVALVGAVQGSVFLGTSPLCLIGGCFASLAAAAGASYLVLGSLPSPKEITYVGLPMALEVTGTVWNPSVKDSGPLKN